MSLRIHARILAENCPTAAGRSGTALRGLAIAPLPSPGQWAAYGAGLYSSLFGRFRVDPELELARTPMLECRDSAIARRRMAMASGEYRAAKSRCPKCSSSSFRSSASGFRV